MFGDFSRFENDPEIGLNGIYLSQGSPILDSDWNEQMAALTDWITVVGQLSTEDKPKKVGFEFKKVGGDFTVSPGMAMLGGRIAQSQSLYTAKWTEEEKWSDENEKQYHRRRIFSGPEASIDTPRVLLSLVSRSLPISQVRGSGHRIANCVAEVTDWAFYITSLARTPSDRTIGDGSFLVPRLKWTQSISEKKLPLSATTCLIEFHQREIDGTPQYKIACSPNNILALDGDPAELLKRNSKIKINCGICILLDITEDTKLFAEYEDDRLVHERSFKTLWPEKDRVVLNDVAKLIPVTIDKSQGKITLTIEGDWPVDEFKDSKKLRPCLRFWNDWKPVKDEKVESTGLGGSAIVDVSDNVHETFLVAGDRWYLPIKEGTIVLKSDERLPGHRVFRGICKLTDDAKSTTMIDQDDSSLVRAAGNEHTNSRPVSERRESVPVIPVAHRLDDSLHRLTGALNATRALTRQTPCKELQTRVSYLPLRRWLASTFVHEIVDLELDSFLAKVQRSIDVAPEDEHRFREQAALVLEEANQLAGRIPSRAEPTNPAVDIV